MEYIFPFALLPCEPKLIRDVSDASARLHKKLKNLKGDALPISEYSKKYLCKIQSEIQANLYTYSYIAVWALSEMKKSMKDVIFMEYGGGTGLLSLLAKEAGIGTVIYNDVYDVSCHDAAVIAREIGNEANAYVQGDVEDALDAVGKKRLHCDCVVSYDVIEHVYDIEKFFTALPLFSKGPLTLVMASSANVFNPVLKKKFTKMHYEAEYMNRTDTWGRKERDCLKAYRDVRREIILNFARGMEKTLNNGEAEQLVRRTRGLAEKDIVKIAETYFEKGVLPPDPAHPTNTCDPFTGNRAEHLFNPFEAVHPLVEAGFRTQVFSGYYRPSENPLKKLAGVLLNNAIRFSGPAGMRLSPFYVIYARREL